MDFLARSDAPIDDVLWNKIDTAVVETVKENIVGRRFIPVENVGMKAQFTKIDSFEKEEVFKDGFVQTTNRKVVEIPQIYSDFWINWRDLSYSSEQESDLDLSQALSAAEQIARLEDGMIFYGNKDLKIDGLLTVSGSQKIKLSDWTKDENAFMDISNAINMLEKSSRYSNHTLIVSSDLYIALQRIQPGTGEIEAHRIKKLIGNSIIKSTVLEDKTALLVSAQKQYLDLVLGQDIATSYLEAVDLNHHFRILETAILRIKAPNAIVVMK